MAENKGTHPPQEHPAKQEFPELKGKIVDYVGIIAESDYYGITIRFQDKTALTFAIEPCVFTFPVFEDWTDREAKIIKEYDPIQSSIGRA